MPVVAAFNRHALRTSLLTPQGVHYDLDAADRPPPRWPWVLGGLWLAAAVAGLLLTFHSRLGGTHPPKRSHSTSVSAAAGSAGTQVQPLPGGATNRAPCLPTAVNAEVRRLMEGAEAAVRAGDLPSARRRYLELLDRGNLGAATAFVEQRLGEIGMLLLLTPRPMPEKIEYIAKSGESADRIALQYKVTCELLLKSNDIRRPDRLQPGQRLLVLDKPRFAIAINRGANELRLFLNGKLLKRYSIGTGRHEETPAGTYAICSRQERPAWGRPDGRKIPYGHPDNILGTRWMLLQATGGTAVARGYGIHGAWNETDLGHATTAGGIRMRNADVEELCLIVPEGTPVRVME